MILRVRPHVGGRRQPVRHVEKGRHGRNVPDVAIGKAGLAKSCAVGLLDLVGRLGQLDGEIEHRLPARLKLGSAIVLGNDLAELGVARAKAHRRTMGRKAIVAMIDGAHGHRDHLALELGEPAFAKHEIVGHVDEGSQLAGIKGIGLEHIGHKAELLLALGEIAFKELVARILGAEVERCHTIAIGHGPTPVLSGLGGSVQFSQSGLKAKGARNAERNKKKRGVLAQLAQEAPVPERGKRGERGKGMAGAY